MNRRSICPAYLIALITLVATAAWASDTMGYAAKPGELSMKLTVTGKQTITAFEPVVLRQKLANVTKHEVWQSIQPEWTSRVEITDASGKAVFETPLKPIPVRFMCGLQKYAPKQSHSYCLIISALYTFKDNGVYTIKVSEGMTDRDGTSFAAVSTASTKITVLPYNEKILNARCKELYDLMVGNGVAADQAIPPTSRSRVFYSIRHDVMLPYLVKYSPGPDAVRAMRRMGSEKALELVKSLTEPESEATKAARAGLSMSLEIGSWDWHTEDFSREAGVNFWISV